MTWTLRPQALGAAAACLSAALSMAPVHAAPTKPSPQATDLCSAAVPCSVQAAAVWQHSVPGEVAVTGRPSTTVGVRAFRVVTSGDSNVLEGFGPSVMVTTDSHGFGRADLEIPARAADAFTGPFLIALADSSGTDLSVVLGTRATLAHRNPLFLGDGYATAKPVGVELTLQVTAALPGARFDVQLDRDGQWESVGTGGAACPDPAAICNIDYQLPRGLEMTRHRMRLIETSSGTPAGEWTMLPSVDGKEANRTEQPTLSEPGGAVPGTLVGATDAVPRPRSQDLDTPDIAADVDGAARGPVAGHEPGSIRRLSLLAGGVAVLVALLGVLRGTTRRVGRRG